MNNSTIAIIALVALVVFLIIAIAASQQGQQSETQVVDPRKRRRAIENYRQARRRQFQRLRRQRQAYMRALKARQQKVIWRRRRHRFISNAKQTLGELFPEMADPRLRSQDIKSLIIQAANHIMTGGRLSPIWRREIRDYVKDTDAFYETKRQLNEWRLAKIEEINNQFQDGKISEEQRES